MTRTRPIGPFISKYGAGSCESSVENCELVFVRHRTGVRTPGSYFLHLVLLAISAKCVLFRFAVCFRMPFE